MIKLDDMHISNEAQFLLDLSQRAGEMAREAFNPMGVPYKSKKDTSPVTVTDIAINRMVIDEVKEKFPEWGVLGEELQWNVENNKTLLLVDPIDGTRPFTFGMGTFGFLVALVIDGKPTIGVMSNPTVRRTLWAEVGNGACHYESGNPIKVSSAETIKGTMCCIDSSSTVSAHLRKNLKLHNARAMGIYSGSEISALVAVGHATASFQELKSPHDVAAAKVVVEEAGGKVTDINGNEQRYDQKINGAIISNGKVHNELLALHKKAIAEDLADPAYKS